MPVYVFECQECGYREEHTLKADDRDSSNFYCLDLVCFNPEPLKRIIVASNILPDIEPYFDENLTNDATEYGGYYCPSYDDRDHKTDGVMITSRSQKKELMKRWGYEYRT